MRLTSAFVVAFVLISIVLVSPLQADSRLHIDLQLQSPNVAFGSDPMIRVSIRNVSDIAESIYRVQPRELVVLTVRDSSGRIVPAIKLEPHMYSAVLMRPFRLDPGESYSPVSGKLLGTSSDWLSLSSWGYPSLPKGTYAITASPGRWLGEPGAFEGTADGATPAKTSSRDSNSVELTID